MHLRLDSITKRFGSFVANDHISLEIASGSIHALLGENGAGKSTLMKILCGLYRPDYGQIYLDDRPVRITSPKIALQHGIGMIYQHFMLVPQLTVVENIILGTTSSWRLDLRQKAAEITQLSQAYGLEVDPHALVETLPVGVQQRVEILKALYRQVRVLILDEPTAVLTPLEVASLFDVLRHLASQDHTIVFISHKLDEVMALCNRITVLQRGKVVATTTPLDTSPSALAQLMVGRDVARQVTKTVATPRDVVLAVHGISVLDDRQLLAVRDLSLEVRAGEILGVAGVDGNGQRELADAIVGLRPVAKGTILLGGHAVTHLSAQQRQAHRELPTIGYIPEDRQTMGLVLSFTIARNLILKAFWKLPFCRRWLLRDRSIYTHAQHAIQTFDIRAATGKLKVSQLSGGNQQKVVLARELDRNPALIIAMQPTRGLDVGATDYVHQQLLHQRDRGAAILYISTELEDVLSISDRIAVIYRGQFLAVIPADQATPEQVGLWMAGKAIGQY
ncbi:MAG: ABC transporter ATP-binding protein [Cyanobacteria bacterium]|nr:ABC transporter ATP-binding protein [Cyanobacteriota bacterium]MDW8200082.1 ABC transporter ATP-binding protein [Cyanobacteriota bacterium SKYGB_h_bin112]